MNKFLSNRMLKKQCNNNIWCKQILATLLFGPWLVYSLGCTDFSEDGSSSQLPPYTIIKDNTFNTKAKELLSGSGSVVFNEPLFGVDSKEHFFLSFQLPNTGSYLKLLTHFSNTLINDGVVLEWKRNADSISVHIETPGESSVDISKFFEGDHQYNNFEYEVEIHDEGGLFRILIWRTHHHIKTEENAFFDSKRAGLYFSSNGQGALWGLELNQATLVKAKMDSSYVH